jgi:hypothetical protein
MADTRAKPETELTPDELAKVGGGSQISTGQAPSTSIGTANTVQVSTSTSRQTMGDTLSSKIVGGVG